MTVVLVADADELILRLLEASLDIFGYEVVSARNGLLAAELAERIRPAVAVIDAALPGIDGAEVARRIAASGHTPRTRVLLIAAWATNIDVRYADAVLQKPFRLEELAERVRALCGE
jgi:DNA-binding response OmpR family regulator